MVGLIEFLLLLLVALWILTRCRKEHKDWKILRQFRYAHRGLHDKPTIPENSMMAFRRAVEHGFGAELDIHLMADGNLAVIHDSSLKRTAGADVCIEDLIKEDLSRFVLEDSQERIPLLDRQVEETEVLQQKCKDRLADLQDKFNHELSALEQELGALNDKLDRIPKLRKKYEGLGIQTIIEEDGQEPALQGGQLAARRGGGTCRLLR